MFIVLLVILFSHMIMVIFSYRGEYLSRYDAQYWKMRYLHSQWVVPDSKESIGDDGLYAYTGWEYITGRNPTTLNAEVPPLGKYFIGLSIVLFKNQNIFALLSGVFVLISFYWLNRIIFKDNLLALIPVTFFSFEPLFTTQLRAPFLDLLYLGFLLLTMVFFLKKQYLWSAVFLGLMASTKNSASTFLIVAGTCFVYFFLTKQYKEIKNYSLTLPVALIAFLLTYMDMFLHGQTFRQFLGVQKWILTFYSNGAKGEFIVPWQMLLTGNWQTWWGQTVRVPEWHIGWAILLVIVIVSGLMMLFYKKFGFEHTFLPSPRPSPLKGEGVQVRKKVFVFIASWCFIYLFFLSFIPVWPRYLLLVLPFMYILLVEFCKGVFEKYIVKSA